MGDGDHVTTPGSIDIGIAEEKYEENETKDDGRETKNPVHTPPVEQDEDNERTDDEPETEIPVFTPPVDMEGYEGEGRKKKIE